MDGRRVQEVKGGEARTMEKLVACAIGMSIGIWPMAGIIYLVGQRWAHLKEGAIWREAWMFFCGVWGLVLAYWCAR